MKKKASETKSNTMEQNLKQNLDPKNILNDPFIFSFVQHTCSARLYVGNTTLWEDSIILIERDH